MERLDEETVPSRVPRNIHEGAHKMKEPAMGGGRPRCQPGVVLALALPWACAGPQHGQGVRDGQRGRGKAEADLSVFQVVLVTVPFPPPSPCSCLPETEAGP